MKVVGTVEFKVADDLKDTLTSYEFDENNGATIDTVVNADYTIDETKKTNVPSNTITATLTFDASKFADLTATTSATKYGTYTVTISPAVTTYAININLSNATADAGNPKTIEEGGTATLVFNAADGYMLPTNIKYSDVLSISGVTVDSWTRSEDGKTGTLVISNPTGNVNVSAICALEIEKTIVTPILIENIGFYVEGEDYTYEMNCNLTENVTYDWYISSDGTNYTFITTTATNSYTRTMLASDNGCYIKCVAYDSYTCYTQVSEQISILFL